LQDIIKDFILPFLALFVIGFQAWLMWVQKTISSKQADISDNQTKILEEQAKNNREIWVARIKVPAKITHFYNGVHGGLQIMIENKGTTAAKNMKYYLEYDLIDKDNLAEVQASIKNKIFARSSREIHSVTEVLDFVGVMMNFRPQDVLKLKSTVEYNNKDEHPNKKPVFILIWGAVSYSDIFDKEYKKPILTLIGITTYKQFNNTTTMPIEISESQQKVMNDLLLER
jgi:hypothetical protein